MTSTNETWLPLGVDGDEAVQFSAPWTDIPEWFQESLWQWLTPILVWEGNGYTGPRFRVEILRRAELALHLKLPVFSDHYTDSGVSAVRSRYTELGSKPLLAFIDFVLSILESDAPFIEELEGLLLRSGSGWATGLRARRPGLVQRLPAGVVAAASEVVRLGDAGKRLADAWDATFGMNPDPSNGYRLAVVAVEHASIRVVPTGKAEPTLGDVIRTLERGTWKLPHLREHDLAPSHDVLVSMLRMLWRGHHDRHGGPSAVGVPAVTQDEAESAVMLAVTLVGWFATGKVQE